MTIKLPDPSHWGSQSLDQVIKSRRSCRDFSDLPVSIDDLSRLLWSAQGVTGAEGERAAPSAGAQYPLQTFVVSGNTKGLTIGLYRYLSQAHVLDPIKQGDLRPALSRVALDEQPWIEEAASLLILAANFEAMNNHFYDQPPFGTRGDRYIYMETGAVMQNIYLEATNCALGVVMVGGFGDIEVKEILGLSVGVLPTALICIGHKG